MNEEISKEFEHIKTVRGFLERLRKHGIIKEWQRVSPDNEDTYQIKFNILKV